MSTESNTDVVREAEPSDPWRDDQDPWARWRAEAAEPQNPSDATGTTEQSTAEPGNDHNNGTTVGSSGWGENPTSGNGAPGGLGRRQWSDEAWRQWLQGTWRPDFGGGLEGHFGGDRRSSDASANSSGATGATGGGGTTRKWWDSYNQGNWDNWSWNDGRPNGGRDGWSTAAGAASTTTSTPTEFPIARSGPTTTTRASTTTTEGRPDGTGSGGGKGPSEKLIIPSFNGEGENGELGTSARSYLRQIDAWERMTKLAPNQRALVLYQHLEGAAWINAEALNMEQLSASDGVAYLRNWVQQHYLDVEVTSVGRSLSDLFRKLKRRYNQSFRDYTAEFNRLLARVVECGCRLPDVATAWLYVDRASLDEATEVSLLASVGNKYQLLQLQQAAIILDRSMRKPWERSMKQDGARKPQTAHLTEDTEHAEDEDPDDEPPCEDVAGEDGEQLYIAYMTAKARYKDTTKARGVDIDAVKKTAEERIKAAKARSYCSVCHQKGHWHRDACCPKRKAEIHTVNVAHEIDSLNPGQNSGLLAITDSACSKSVVGTAWLQAYLNMVRNQGKAAELIPEREAFRFGASRVYESTYSTIIVFHLGKSWVVVKASVIHGDIPLLLSKPCLAKLGMILDLEKNTADFRKLGIKDLRLLTTPSGHPAVPVCHKGKSPPEPSSLPKTWSADGTEILAEIAEAYMISSVGDGVGSFVEDADRLGFHRIFYEKKLDEAARTMLVGDHLCHATFLQWWSNCPYSNDFWIETPEKLVRVHVTPRKSYFNPENWRTQNTLQRDLLQQVLGSVRESWGIACSSQRPLSTVCHLWKDTSHEGEHGSYPTLWIGRSVFNRDRPSSLLLAPVRDEQRQHADMEDEQGGAPRRVQSAQPRSGPEVDPDRTAPCPSGGCQALLVPGAKDRNAQEHLEDDPGRARGGGDRTGHRGGLQGTEGRHHAEDPRLHGPGQHSDDHREVPRRDLREHPNVLCGVGLRGGEGQRRQHAPRAQEVRHLEAQPEEPSGYDRSQDQATAERLPGRRGECHDPASTDERDRSLRLGMGRGGTNERIFEHPAQDEYATYEETPRGGRRHQEDGKGRGTPHVGGDPSTRGTTGMSEGCSWSGTATVKEHYIGEVEACDKGGDRATTRSREGHIKETTEDLYPNDQPYECNAGDGHPEPHDEEITQDFHPKDQSNEHGDTTIVQGDHDEATDKDIFQTSATEGNSGDEPGTRPSSLSSLRHEILCDKSEAQHYLAHDVYTSAHHDTGEEMALTALRERRFGNEDLEAILDACDFHNSKKRPGVHGGEEERRCVIGYYAYGKFHGVTRETGARSQLAKYINQFLLHNGPSTSTSWTSLSITYNTPAHVHTDKNNFPGSDNVVWTGGEHRGGGLWVAQSKGEIYRQDANGEPTPGNILETKGKVTRFNPKHKHASEPWEGNRWSVVAYVARSYPYASKTSKKVLQKLLFPVPTAKNLKDFRDNNLNKVPQQLPEGRPRRTTQRNLWKNTAALCVMMATSMATMDLYAQDHVEPRGRPKVALLEIGGVEATCYATGVCNDNIDVAEPLFYNDLKWADRVESCGLGPIETATIRQEPAELWLHVSQAWICSETKEDAEKAIDRQLREGRQVVLQRVAGERALWEEATAGWEDAGYAIIYDHDHYGNEYVRIDPYGEVDAIHPSYVVEAEDAPKAHREGARSIHFPPSVPRYIATSLRRLHQNLGHPSEADFVRHLRLAGASREVLKAARSLECQTCARTKATAIARPARIGSCLKFNEVVGADLFYVHDTEGNRHELLSIVDYSSAYHVVIPVERKDTPHLEKAFCEHRANIFGAPDVVTVDLENGLQKALARVGDWTGMRIKSAAGQAHWQAGFTERLGGVWKSIFARINEEMSVTKRDILLATSAVSGAKNSLTRANGYSPLQHVFGSAPRLPEDLLEGPHARAVSDEAIIDDKHAREVALRTSARAAYHHVQTDERVRRALAGRARVQARRPAVGEQVFYFRKTKNAKRGMWMGPGTVIGEEGSNLWISKSGRCVLCAEEHVRLATPEELGHAFSLRVAREDLEKLLGADPEDEETYEPEEAAGIGDFPDDLEELMADIEPSEPSEIAYDMDVEAEEQRSNRRNLDGPEPPPLRRKRRKGPPDSHGAARLPNQVNMLKKARTERSRAKQLEKEIPWGQIPEEVRPLFLEAEKKQWSEHIQPDALEVLDVATSKQVRAEVPRERILPSRYAYRDKAMGKRKACPGTPWRAKARLVVGGHMDPDLRGGTFGSLVTDSPTINRSSLVMLLQLAVSLRMQMATGDVQAAFLNGLELGRELFMEQPRGGVEGLDPLQLLRIKKGIFGLAESPRMWYDRLYQVLTEEVFEIEKVQYRLRPCPLDPCVFLLQNDEDSRPKAYVGIHVDDLLVVAHEKFRLALQGRISELFPVDSWEEGEFDYIGSRVTMKDDTVTVNQSAFVEGRLFSIEVDKSQDGNQPATEEQAIDNKSLIGALSWLSSQSRPDIQCSVALAQQLQQCPLVDDVRFTNATANRAATHRDKGLTLYPIELEKATIVVYHDAAWANAEHEEAEPGFQLNEEEIREGTIGAGLYSTERPRQPKRARSKLASQLGHLVCLCDRGIAEGKRVQMSILEWRSQACKRAFGAETMSAVEGLEAAQYLRSLLATLVTGKLAKHNDALNFCPVLALTDCKSLHDYLHRAGQPRLPSDRRLAIDLAALRQDLRAEVPEGARVQAAIPLRWIPTTMQMADILTKPKKGDDWWAAWEEGIQLPFSDGTLNLRKGGEIFESV